MKKFYFSALLVLCAMLQTTAQSLQRTPFIATVVDETRNIPLEGAMVKNRTSNEVVLSNETGQFSFKNKPSDADSLVVSAIGHEQKTITVKELFANNGLLSLRQKAVTLRELVIVGGRTNPTQLISQVDIKLRAINNSQEVLRMVPGLFIGQHAGGGKAEQIFLRGFDIDHGTDISIGVDGMPVNMVSHAHGQGYADLHFLIPELIDKVSFQKGTYAADKGNFATSGVVDFKTANALTSSSVKLEAGIFNTFRTVGMFNLLSKTAKEKAQSAYIASEFMYTKGYFNNPQDFNRINLFGKYNGALSRSHQLNVSASFFSSRWDASGQIPDRAVETGMIGFFGAIDPNEGGKTSRANGNVILTSTLQNGSYFRNQAYYSKYQFDLYSNFTFFKEDPVNGDQIKQRENRNLYGYNGSYHKTAYIGNVKLISELGASARMDRTDNSELSRTKDRTTIITPVMLGDISENNFAAYVSETIAFSPRFSLNAGLRYDLFQNKYTDRLNGNVQEKASASIVSPKLNLFYHLSPNLQLYLNTGRGFHSNDTRVVVPQNGLQILPAAYGSDFGAVLKPSKNLLVNAALWYLWLDQEFVYVGDEGVVEPSGKSKRYGADLSLRYQPLHWLYADLDFNYSHARAVGEPKGEDYLPLAPKFTSIGGLTAKLSSGINASLRYRYVGDRPANEDNSVVAKGYFITDAFLSYQMKKYEIGLSARNLLDVKWKETQFDTESRLFNESQPVSEIHFTPGTPFFIKASFTYLF
jgi:outer membrane receptor protein involved in Fe transport